MFDFLKKKKKMTQFDINKDTKIGDLLKYDSGIAGVLAANGMACTTCPSAQGESLEIACYVHGIQVQEMLAAIYQYEKEKTEK